jgi:hypothetical protein
VPQTFPLAGGLGAVYAANVPFSGGNGIGQAYGLNPSKILSVSPSGRKLSPLAGGLGVVYAANVPFSEGNGSGRASWVKSE